MFASIISKKNRFHKYNLLISLLAPKKIYNLPDIGVNNIEFSSFDNFLKKNNPLPEKITALAVGKNSDFKTRYPKVNIRII